MRNRRCRKACFILFICLSCARAAPAQKNTAYIKGQVTEKGGSQGIPGVIIHTPDGRICTSSNADGYYRPVLPADNGEPVIFSAFGYQRDTLPAARLKNHPQVKLRPGGIMLQAVAVTEYTPHGLMDEVLRRIPEIADTCHNENRWQDAPPAYGGARCSW